MADDRSRNAYHSPRILRRVWRLLARVDLAAVLIVVVLLVVAIGSCFPQLSPLVAANPKNLSRWETAIRARYGALADVLATGGAFRCFRSPLFLVPLALLELATLVCTLSRWRGVWRWAFHQPVHCSDGAFESAPHTAVISAPLTVDLAPMVCEGLERRGFRVRSETAHGARYLRGDRNRLAPAATLVTHLAVLVLLLGAATSRGYGWREELTVGPGETLKIGHGSGLAVRNEGFAVARYPDGSVAGYEAHAACIFESREVAAGSLRVGDPMACRSVGLYLHGYGGTEGAYSVTYWAVHDPGYALVVGAGFLLLLGMTVSFNFPHCWVHARIGPGSALRLAGRADRRAWDFGREFESLERDLLRRAEGCEQSPC